MKSHSLISNPHPQAPTHLMFNSRMIPDSQHRMPKRPSQV
jgi:hypothetical protein